MKLPAQLKWKEIRSAFHSASRRDQPAAHGLSMLKTNDAVQELKRAFDEANIGPTSLGVGESAPGVVSILLANAANANTSPSPLDDLLFMLRGSRPIDPTKQNPSTTEDINPNSLLDSFERETGLFIVGRKWVGARGLRISFALVEEDDSEIDTGIAFRYSPSHELVTTWDSERGVFDRNLEQTRRQALSNQMTSLFFSKAATGENYMMDDALQAALNLKLPQYFAAGLRANQERGFIPPPSLATESPVGLYLYGAPGVGKSTFVGVFARALKHVLRQYADPNLDVRVIKVPLNAMTPSTLTHVLSIQGISDWSVERVVEQAINNGHIAVLHLEEAPDDKQTQTKLYECLDVMLAKLFRRYPEYKSNVIFLFTSNNEWGPSVPKYATPMVVQHPSSAAQLTWCRRVLNGVLKTSEFVELNECPTSEVGDVRPLNAFWMSVGFVLDQLRGDLPLKKAFVGKPVFNTSTNRNKWCLEVGWRDTSPQSSVILESDDGFFYVEASKSNGIGDIGVEVGVGGENLSRKTIAVLEMTIAGFLTPGVIVVVSNGSQGGKGVTNETEYQIINAVKTKAVEAGRGISVSEVVELLNEDDEPKVLGSAGEIRGGLLRFIDDATNPKVKRARLEPDVCVVRARVNELGSLLLRELLEAGDKSRTHRLGVSKKGLLFVVTLIPGAQLTPQLSSRAH